jgi:hypothetical protein
LESEGGLKGFDLDYYLDELHVVLAKTLREFRSKDDAWLFEDRPFTKSDDANNRYIWYHVFEGETDHRGQVKWIKKRIPR